MNCIEQKFIGREYTVDDVQPGLVGAGCGHLFAPFDRIEQQFRIVDAAAPAAAAAVVHLDAAEEERPQIFNRQIFRQQKR